MHVTHVGFDGETGQFTGLPKEWDKMLREYGVTEEVRDQNPDLLPGMIDLYERMERARQAEDKPLPNPYEDRDWWAGELAGVRHRY